jgi:hypothetical protein
MQDDAQSREVFAYRLLIAAQTIRRLLASPLPISAVDRGDLSTAASICERVSMRIAAIETRDAP